MAKIIQHVKYLCQLSRMTEKLKNVHHTLEVPAKDISMNDNLLSRKLWCAAGFSFKMPRLKKTKSDLRLLSVPRSAVKRSGT